jgi:hypothetical protein
MPEMRQAIDDSGNEACNSDAESIAESMRPLPCEPLPDLQHRCCGGCSAMGEPFADDGMARSLLFYEKPVDLAGRGGTDLHPVARTGTMA